jgi:hypothetical protein
VTVESTSRAGPSCWARWPAAELTRATQQRRGGEGASARWCLSATRGVSCPTVELTRVTQRRGGREGALAWQCLSATRGVRWSAVASGSPKAPWIRGGHEERFKLKSCQPEGTSHREGVEMVAT